jgi:hypothetical protein
VSSVVASAGAKDLGAVSVEPEAARAGSEGEANADLEMAAEGGGAELAAVFGAR